MKQAIHIAQPSAGGLHAVHATISIPAAPWGDIAPDARPETAPRRKGLIATLSIADQFIAALREAHRSQK